MIFYLIFFARTLQYPPVKNQYDIVPFPPPVFQGLCPCSNLLSFRTQCRYPDLSIRANQPGKRHIRQFPLVLLLFVHFRYHEGIGHFVSSNDGQERDPVPDDGGVINNFCEDFVDIRLLVVNASTADDIDFPLFIQLKYRVIAVARVT